MNFAHGLCFALLLGIVVAIALRGRAAQKAQRLVNRELDNRLAALEQVAALAIQRKLDLAATIDPASVAPEPRV